AEGAQRMREEGVPSAQVRVAYSADMRYVGQSYELEVPVAAPLRGEALPAVQAAFHAAHERIYGYHRAGQPVEFINFRAVHTYPLPRPPVRSLAVPRGSLAGARVGERRVYFAPAGFTTTPIFARARLPVGERLPGPAVIEQTDTTVVIPPGYAARVEEC